VIRNATSSKTKAPPAAVAAAHQGLYVVVLLLGEKSAQSDYSTGQPIIDHDRMVLHLVTASPSGLPTGLPFDCLPTTSRWSRTEVVAHLNCCVAEEHRHVVT
jgi:hypothetical protein